MFVFFLFMWDESIVLGYSMVYLPGFVLVAEEIQSLDACLDPLLWYQFWNCNINRSQPIVIKVLTGYQVKIFDIYSRLSVASFLAEDRNLSSLTVYLLFQTFQIMLN